jgi:hypothetical protein
MFQFPIAFLQQTGCLPLGGILAVLDAARFSKILPG